MVSLFEGDLEQASAQFRQSFVTTTELGDERGVSSALFHLALSAYFAGDREVAEQQAAEALELRRTVGQPVGVAYCEGLLASLAPQLATAATMRAPSPLPWSPWQQG